MTCGTRPALLGLLLAATGGWGLRAAPDDSWRGGTNYRSLEVHPALEPREGFSNLPPESTGVTFSNRLSRALAAANRILEIGSGVALGDIDGDGLCDIYFCGLEGRNALYRNLGQWKFEDVTERAGVACAGQFSTGAVLVDTDGDGDLDLLVNSIGGGTRAFLNDGKGVFTEQTGTRLVRRFGSTSMALADIDGDGDLDLYVANYRTDTYNDRPPGLKVEVEMIGGKIVVTPPDRFVPIMPRAGGVEMVELGERDFIYVNDGRGVFAPISWTAGSFRDEDGKALTQPPLDWTLAVMFRDMDGDGQPDLYTCSDFFYSPDRIWLNRAGFQAAPRTFIRNMSLASMAVDFADINRDGLDDFVVVDMLSRDHRNRHRQRPNMMKGIVNLPLDNPGHRPEVPRNTLFLNRGDGTYAEIAQLAGVAATEWSWGAIFLDVDLDGYEDLLVANGNNHDVQDADTIDLIQVIRDRESGEQRLSRFPPLHTANLAFRNRGDLTFEEIGARWGFDVVGVSQGMALADLDNDGDLDVVINNLNAPATLLRNEGTAPRVAVRLRGNPPNTRGIGAKIRLLGGPVTQQQEMISGGRYLSCDDAVRVFAAGSTTNRLRLEVIWPGGRVSVVDAVRVNRIYEIFESSSAPRQLQPPAGPRRDWLGGLAEPLFEDASDRLNHRHHDEPFDDFARQPLLPRKFSQRGPGAAWVDFDRDGHDDLVIGGGRGGVLAVFRNTGHGGFDRVEATGLGPLTRDLTGLVTLETSSTNTLLLAGFTNYEDAASNGSSVRMLDFNRPAWSDLPVARAESVGPLALGDIDGDGDLDLFVGGSALPRQYPLAAPSRLYRNDGGRWVLDERNETVLRDVGPVNGALFVDLDGDGRVELVLACEWGPVRVLRSNNGLLTDITSHLGLDQFTGWWNGVATGDFDGDGRPDLVASNWGRNTRYQPHLSDSIQIAFADFDGDTTFEVLETYLEPVMKKHAPWTDFKTATGFLPFIREHTTTYRDFGSKGLDELLGARASLLRRREARTLDSMLFLNRGGIFEARPLPVEAQFAPAFGLAVADFDGDGREDLFLAQNFFGVDADTSRYDGGQGLLLRGDGRGGWTAVPGFAAGIDLPGEQRACAVADFDGDRRPDLLVTQNRGASQLHRNRSGRPGIRVRLHGPPENARAIGAVVRLESAAGLGPARAIHAGSGYWSQDGSAPILAMAGEATRVHVTWPGGRRTVRDIAHGATDVQVRFDAPASP